jgi:hypothetical protein
MTAAPSSYELIYPVPCEVEGKCGDIECGGPEFNARPQVFCQDVTINANLTVQGSTSLGQTSIRPAAITVGGQTFTPMVISTISGPHLVLAVY